MEINLDKTIAVASKLMPNIVQMIDKNPPLIFGINIFPSDVYYLDKMPSEINLFSTSVVFILSIVISSVASYFPAKTISKMNTTNALKYD